MDEVDVMDKVDVVAESGRAFRGAYLNHASCLERARQRRVSGLAAAAPLPNPETRNPKPETHDRGAALIVAIAVLTILLAVALTFFTVTRQDLKTSTNVENSVRADALNIGAVNMAIAFLKHDAKAHPSYTSLDHAWRTYFNGAWIVGKKWAFPNGTDYSLGYIPEIYFTNQGTGQPGGGGTGHLYVPRAETTPLLAATPGLELMQYLDGTHPFVTDPAGVVSTNDPTKKLTVPEQIDQWADVDNDEDGLKDSVWIPMSGDVDMGAVLDSDGNYLSPGDGVDNDLSGPFTDDDGTWHSGIDESHQVTWRKDPNTLQWSHETKKIMEAGVFLYWGGNDGRNNMGTGAPPDGPDEQRWFLTCPILDAAGQYVTLQNVQLMDTNGVSYITNINTDPAAGNVDVLDNDYDLVINKYDEFFTPADPAPDLSQVKPPYDDSNPNYVAYVANLAAYDKKWKDLQTFFDTRVPPLHWLHAISNVDHAFDNMQGIHEISPNYLPDKTWRIKSTGEPVSDLVGRAAILITDEASKVNLNAAGGRNLDVARIVSEEKQGGQVLATDYATKHINGNAQNPLQYYTSAVGQGATPAEYCTLVLPNIGEARSSQMWSLLMGYPFNNDSTLPISADDPGYVPDVILPGYGFADDDGNALTLAMNGIDDNGNGLVDEGVNDGKSLTPEQAQAAADFATRNGWNFTGTTSQIAEQVYQQFLGRYFEGIDEPGEYRTFRPYRNSLAEQDGTVKDDNGNTNVTGEYGDHALKTREEIEKIFVGYTQDGVWHPGSQLAQTILESGGNGMTPLKDFLTLHSADDNQFRFTNPASGLPAAGIKLDLNHAPAQEIADALRDNLGMHSPYEYRGDVGTNYWQQRLDQMDQTKAQAIVNGTDPHATDFQQWMFKAGLLQQDVSRSFSLCDQSLGPASLYNVFTTQYGNQWFPADPYLRAMKIGALLADSRRTDLARTEITTSFDDQWWYYQSVKAFYAQNSDINLALANGEHRPIKYTITGLGGLRITEMMVRPVRRVEAEIGPTDPHYNPNMFAVYDPNKHPIPLAFYVSVHDLNTGDGVTPGIPAAIDANKANTTLLYDSTQYPVGGLWPQPTPPGRTSSNPGSGFIGEATVRNTQHGNFPGLSTLTSSSVNLPNIIEYEFKPSAALPPGRYYLTINVNDVTGNMTAPDAQHPIYVATKYVCKGATTELPLWSKNKYPATLNLDLLPAGDPRKPKTVGKTTICEDISRLVNNSYLGLLWDEFALIKPAQADQNWTDFFGSWFWTKAIVGHDASPAQKPLSSVFVPTIYWNTLPAATMPLLANSMNNNNIRADLNAFPNGMLLNGYGQDQAFTVTIPYYTESGNADDQVSLHVAIYAGWDPTVATEPQKQLAINFFDFSQEPDHEWIEVENVSGHDIDFSYGCPPLFGSAQAAAQTPADLDYLLAWSDYSKRTPWPNGPCELVVGGVDSAGNVVTDDQAVLQIPQYDPRNPANPLVLPKGQRMILAFKAEDYFEQYEQYATAAAAGTALPIEPSYTMSFLTPDFTKYPSTGYPVLPAGTYSYPVGTTGEYVPNLLYSDGIGLIGGGSVGIGSSAGPHDFSDVTYPAIPPRVSPDSPAYILANDTDGRGDFIANDPLTFVQNTPSAPGEQIVQLIVKKSPKECVFPISMSDVDPATEIATWVLRGGIFPNYPDHDGVDNSNCADAVENDSVSNAGDCDLTTGVAFDDPRKNYPPPHKAGIDAKTITTVWDASSNTNVPLVPPILGESIDRGNYRHQQQLLGEGSATFTAAGWPAAWPVGAFGGWPVNYTMLPSDAVLASLASDCPPYIGQATWPVLYGTPNDPPDWKQFVERRFFATDSVFVTLFEGPKENMKVIDRVTYTEQDVINRSTDDLLDVRDPATGQWDRPTLYWMFPQSLDPLTGQVPVNYMTCWPDNTMGIDFYRTLERKHSAYYDGDRFGTKNRWEAMDGNYDDWAHDPVQTLDAAGSALLNALNFSGTPLLPNAAYDPDPGANPNDPTFLALLQAADPTNYQKYQSKYLGLTNESLDGYSNFQKKTANTIPPLDSFPDVTTTKYYSWNNTTNEYSYPEGVWLDKSRINELDHLTLSPRDLSALTPANVLESLTPGMPDPMPVMPVLPPGIDATKDQYSASETLAKYLGQMLTTSAPVRLGCSTADFYLLEPSLFETPQFSAMQTAMNWASLTVTSGATVWTPPSAWSPVLLYSLEADPAGDLPPDNTSSRFNQATTSGGFPYWMGAQQNVLDAYHFLFKLPQLPQALSLANLKARWPYERRISLFVAENPVGVAGQDPTLNQKVGSVALFVWNANSGVENGEYDLFLDTGGDLTTALQKTDYAANNNTTNPREALTGGPTMPGIGRGLAEDATLPSQMVFDVEVFTDRSYPVLQQPSGNVVRMPPDGRCWSRGTPVKDPQIDNTDVTVLFGGNFDRASTDPLLPPQVQQARGDSLGQAAGLRADANGLVHFGTVRVENHFLAVLIRNRSDAGRLNRFAGVLLAPADRTPGRINVNTAETRLCRTTDGNTRLFNSLMGLPGILLNAVVPYDPDNANPPIMDNTWDWTALPDINEARPVGDPAIRQARLEHARLVELGRTDWPDGRYYAFVTDLTADANPNPIHDPNNGPAIGSLGFTTDPATGKTVPKLFPLTNSAVWSPDDSRVDHPARNGLGAVIYYPTDLTQPINEVNWRFDRLANLVTTHSDVFEILVTVQTGYGVDLNGDGIIDYRSRDPNNQEFVITSEKKTRTIYAR